MAVVIASMAGRPAKKVVGEDTNSGLGGDL
jgi:hypothetical protein